mmetsp:Transcript_131403/g.327717  ORF Transcript_131403/g.327717 Transcript_131403/m.327717 type:complete len:211 (-) Transcript_131403:65-697(-)
MFPRLTLSRLHSHSWHLVQLEPSLQPFGFRAYLQASAQLKGWPTEPTLVTSWAVWRCCCTFDPQCQRPPKRANRVGDIDAIVAGITPGGSGAVVNCGPGGKGGGGGDTKAGTPFVNGPWSGPAGLQELPKSAPWQASLLSWLYLMVPAIPTPSTSARASPPRRGRGSDENSGCSARLATATGPLARADRSGVPAAYVCCPSGVSRPMPQL